MPLPMLRRPAPVAILIALVAEALFLVRLSVPHKLVFDEVHYVPAARTLLALAGPANIEHPLLAKAFIALGIRLFGDTPYGWRVFSTLAAVVVVLSVFSLAWSFTRALRPSAVAAILVVLNFTLFVQARIAMLDGYMAAFTLAGLAMLAHAMRARGRGWWVGGAAMLGLAVACKWTAAPYVAFVAAAFVWAKREDGARWRDIGMIEGIALLGAVSIAVYFVTFAPAFFYADEPMTLARLLPFQWEMYQRQTQVLPAHTYQSPWWGWPLPLRPIWYLYEPADDAMRGILLIGNPAVMWAGVAAVLACLWGWVKTGAPRLIAVAGLWLCAWLIWAVIPKSLGFYYYYYLPSLVLPVVIAVALDHWRGATRHWDAAIVALSAALFVYFLPILSAWALPDPGAFHRWTWLRSWI
ncbi:putative dolichyl-phosphate-mannose--protein mannosyltransferase [Sphingomonas sp. EC-HK361]|nr:putative dolichyl-phosphate-mannose--protein mannosyltransferase [Sphingomonas sp. EC-HK361]